MKAFDISTFNWRALAARLIEIPILLKTEEDIKITI
jgi:hypothetical protein